MAKGIHFGTDGWRGEIARDFTFEAVQRAAQGFATYIKQQKKEQMGVVVGYDMRFHSENFAAAVAEVLAGNGMRAYLTQGPTPTPVIAYAVVTKQAGGAVNITASHNPPTDNGFKVRDHHGGAIDPDGLAQIGDESALLSIVQDVIGRNPDAVAQYRAGKNQTFGFMVGQVMKASGGKANPKLANQLLKRELDDA